jgi:hypothetical protein
MGTYVPEGWGREMNDEGEKGTKEGEGLRDKEEMRDDAEKVEEGGRDIKR